MHLLTAAALSLFMATSLMACTGASTTEPSALAIQTPIATLNPDQVEATRTVKVAEIKTEHAPIPESIKVNGGVLVPMSVEAANDSMLFLEELSAPERDCVEGVYETMPHQTLREFSLDLNDCLEDETHLRRITHAFGIAAFSGESSACIRREAGALDLNHVMLAGPPMTVDLLLAGQVVQWCMTDDEFEQVAGGRAAVERVTLDCLFKDGVASLVKALRPHQGDDDALLDVYNHVVDAC